MLRNVTLAFALAAVSAHAFGVAGVISSNASLQAYRSAEEAKAAKAAKAASSPEPAASDSKATNARGR